MKSYSFTQIIKLSLFAGVALAGVISLQAQTGPFAATNWPPTVKADAKVDYYIGQRKAGFDTPAKWLLSLSFADEGDQTYDLVTRNGLKGLMSTANFMNLADTNFAAWAEVPVIDVLLQVYGDKALVKEDGGAREILFREGPLHTEKLVSGGTIPTAANNGQWNWMLFSITNEVNAATGKRYLGNVPDATLPGVDNGGVNQGTLRIENVPGITIRAVAIGEHGAFGKPEQINVFAPKAAETK